MSSANFHDGKYLYMNRFVSILAITAALVGGTYALLTLAPAQVEEAAGPAVEAVAVAATPVVAEPVAPAAAEPAPVEPVAAAEPAPAKPSLLGTMTAAEGGLFNLVLPTGKTVAIAETGVETKLIGFLEDDSQPIDKKTWFEFDRLGFDTGSANLTATSQAQVESIAAILEAFPTAHIKLGGYTDNTGNPAFNLKLSDDRAQSVLAALVGKGVAAERLAAEGYGDQHPVATNDTEEGRAQNRRTALSVRQR